MDIIDRIDGYLSEGLTHKTNLPKTLVRQLAASIKTPVPSLRGEKRYNVPDKLQDVLTDKLGLATGVLDNFYNVENKFYLIFDWSTQRWYISMDNITRIPNRG